MYVSKSSGYIHFFIEAYMDNNFTIKVKRKKRPEKDMTISVSSEVYEALRFFSSETGYPIKMLADALLRFGMDNIRVVYEDEGDEVG